MTARICITLIFLFFHSALYAMEESSADGKQGADQPVLPKMEILEKYKTHQESLKRFTKKKTHTEEYNQLLNEMAWVNPAPSISDLNLDNKQLENLVQDRIVLMMHAPRDVDVPYYGEMIRWYNARFVSAVTEVPMSAEAMRQLIIETDQQDGWKNVEPFVRSTDVTYRHEPEQVGLRYKIQAKISIIRVNGNIYIRNKYEDDGDITSLFLTGDIGVAFGIVPIIPKAVLSPLTVANVRRWEFIPIDENRSFLAITDWAEVMNDTHLSKRMSQYDEDSNNLGGISDEDLIGPYPGVAANLYNFKKTVMKIYQRDNEIAEEKVLLDKGVTPDIKDSIDKKTLAPLLENGAVVFMHPRQDIKASYGSFPLHFVTAAYPVNASFEDLRRYSAQMDHYADYVPQLESSKLVKGTFDIPDFSNGVENIPPAEVKLKLSLGKHLKFISSFDIDYRLRYSWESPTRLVFEDVEGSEIETIHGAVEWLPGTARDKSILFYTNATDLGPNPKFPLNLSQHIPGSDIVSGVMVSVMAAGRQGPWAEMQLETEAMENEKQETVGEK